MSEMYLQWIENVKECGIKNVVKIFLLHFLVLKNCCYLTKSMKDNIISSRTSGYFNFIIVTP